MLLLAIPAPTAYVQQHLTAAEKLSLATSPYKSTADLFADCMAACIDDVIGTEEIFTRTQFEAARDRVWLSEVQEATQRYVSAGGDLPLQPDAPEHLRHARWMLEELRVGLFAQHLPTAEPVSLQRITKVLGGG